MITLDPSDDGRAWRVGGGGVEPATLCGQRFRDDTKTYRHRHRVCILPLRDDLTCPTHGTRKAHR